MTKIDHILTLITVLTIGIVSLLRLSLQPTRQTVVEPPTCCCSMHVHDYNGAPYDTSIQQTYTKSPFSEENCYTRCDQYFERAAN